MNAVWLASALAGLLVVGPPAVRTGAREQAGQGAALERLSIGPLLSIRRVYVDRLAGGETAAQMRDMIIASLQSAKLFVLTENPELADAVLRGSAEDLVFTDTFSTSEGLSANARLGGSEPGRTSSNRRSGYASLGVSEHESVRIAERKHEASASVRLVDKHGDVIWSTTQESQGAKFRSASADVADKIARQLLGDYQRARNSTAPDLRGP